MIKKSVFLFLILIFMSGVVSAALGISPAVKKYNFVPGEVIKINFDVISDNPEQEIELYTAGDLTEFVTLDKERITGPGGVTATIFFPQELDRPGDHFLGIGAREIPPEASFVGSAIDVRATIKVFAPFPGRYIDATLNIPDGNIDEEIPVELYVVNRGKENLNTDVYIDFFDGNGDAINRMTFESATINTTNERYFRKFLDTTGYRPGDYVAEAVISYGEETRVNKTFRVGSLFVNVTNFTERLQQKEGFQEFSIGVESKWNGDLEEVFADVNISNDLNSIVFRTPSIDLQSWTPGELVGFIDTEQMEGKYDVEIVLSYADQQTIVHGILSVFKFDRNLIAWVIAGIAVIVIVIIVWLIKKRGRRRK